MIGSLAAQSAASCIHVYEVLANRDDDGWYAEACGTVTELLQRGDPINRGFSPPTHRRARR